MFKAPNEYREKRHLMNQGSVEELGNNGFFIIPHYRIKNYVFICVASDGMEWEHVSVSVSERGKKQHRCPTWDEMCWIKDKFWSKDQCVIQYHPAEEEYVNLHPYCLHLWRPTGETLPIPVKEMVGW